MNMNTILPNPTNSPVPTDFVPGTEGMEIRKPQPIPQTRQCIRAEMTRRAFRNLSERFRGDRASRRTLARQIAKDLWKRGERLNG